jgi:hypothetical protein
MNSVSMTFNCCVSLSVAIRLDFVRGESTQHIVRPTSRNPSREKGVVWPAGHSLQPSGDTVSLGVWNEYACGTYTNENCNIIVPSP